MHTARRARGVVALIAVGWTCGLVATARAACDPCVFGGLCFTDDGPIECGPTSAGCIPNGGILLFNSVPPNIPAYWTVFAERRSRPGRLRGTIKVWGDAALEPPNVPGFPPVRCEESFCFGRDARFAAAVVGDRFTGVARYRGGARCQFSGTLQFGFGDAAPNTFSCTAHGGEPLSAGSFDLQGIRLRGCQQ